MIRALRRFLLRLSLPGPEEQRRRADMLRKANQRMQDAQRHWERADDCARYLEIHYPTRENTR